MGPATKKKFNKRVRCIIRHMGNYTLEVNERHCKTIQKDWAFILQRKHREKKFPEWQRKAIERNALLGMEEVME